MQILTNGAAADIQAGVQSPASQAVVRTKLGKFFLVFFALWLMSVSLVLARGKFFLKLADPTLSFWFDNGKDAHADISGFNTRTQRFTSRETGEPVVVYPGTMMMCYMAITRWTASPARLYGVIIFTIALILALCFGRFLNSVVLDPPLAYSAALVGVGLFYPLWFVFERSNVEAILWLPTALSVLAFVLRQYKMAAVLIALAASLKIYPGILMLMFLRKIRHRDLILSLASYVAFTAIGLWWLNPNLLAAWKELNAGMTMLTHSHLTRYESAAIGYDHSFFSVVKQLIRFRFPDIAHYHYETMRLKIVSAMQAYVVIAPLAFAALFLVFIRRLPDLNRLIILLILSVTLPPVSYEYTLVQVLPAYLLLFLYLIHAPNRGDYVSVRWHLAVSASFIIVSLPLAFLSGSSVGYGGQIKLFALLIPIAFCCLHPVHVVLKHEFSR